MSLGSQLRAPRKMALQKLRKLRDTIRSLPATALRQQLVEAVKEHPVVLVAGAGWRWLVEGKCVGTLSLGGHG